MRWPILMPLWLATGCTTILGIDGDYSGVLHRKDGGARETGGSAGTGGTAPSGDADIGGAPTGGAGTGGAETGGANTGGATGGAGGMSTGGAGVDAQAQCQPGEKLCPKDGVDYCVKPDPGVGCGPTGCTQCPAPPGGYPTCNGESCDFDCYPGYVRNGDRCDPEAAVDASAGGSGGGSTRCMNDSDCPRCGAALGCCTLVPSGICGCNFVWCTPPLLP